MDKKAGPAPMRLGSGGRVDRNRPLTFRFDGKTYSGFHGDTLASALIASGVHLAGRSFKYHRRRGFLAAGNEEPNALVRLIEGNGKDKNKTAEPNLKATQVELFDGLVAESQNRWPGLEFDLMAVNSMLAGMLPAGFYYKTFMWPQGMWPGYARIIRRMAGLGRVTDKKNSNAGGNAPRYEKTYGHCDVLIAGGGAAGLMAALAAGRAGARVILADEQNEFGGWLLAEADTRIGGHPAGDWVANIVRQLAALETVRLMPRSTVFGYGDHNYLLMAERVTDHMAEKPAHLPRQRLHKIRAGAVILAQGCHERPAVFAGNDLPGVMLAGAVRAYINRYGALPGRRGLVFTNNDDAYRTAFALADAGCAITAIVDTRSKPEGELIASAKRRGIKIHNGHAVLKAEGSRHLGRVRIAPLDKDGGFDMGNAFYIDCDLLAMSAGFTPVVSLHSQSGGRLEWDAAHHCFRPGAARQKSVSIGAGNGDFDLRAGLKGAIAAGIKSAAKRKKYSPPAMPQVSAPQTGLRIHDAPVISGGLDEAAARKAFIDFQNDVTAGDIRLALREGYHSVEHVKRYTTAGMATDQGKTSNINALEVMATGLNRPVPEIGTTTFRPPYTPTAFGAIAGRDTGEFFDPVRLTRMDGWHRANGAEYEHVGQWMRPHYYPQDGESMHDAVGREVARTRKHAGLLDASTLGKIDVRGGDAAEFLNRVYTNAWSNLGIGRCRYGLMLKDDGMVFDDGVTTRLGENHFHMTTTTGGAGPVLDWLEELKQTYWPELDVYMTSVTEQWAVASLAGPKAREILESLGCSVPLDNASFPFMSYKDAHLAGLPVRIFRISFTGESSFEINVPARLGPALWRALMEAGAPHGLTPYGTEAMHVLRAEKGFIIVGQDTDGTVTPYDLGLGRMVADSKPDFIGKRALGMAGLQAPGRKQLVGLRTENPNEVIPEGAHAVADKNASPPMNLLGHVTSSYYSPNLGHSIALALIRDGHAMEGEMVWLPMLDKRKPVKATITGTVFYDPKGEKLNA